MLKLTFSESSFSSARSTHVRTLLGAPPTTTPGATTSRSQGSKGDFTLFRLFLC